MLCSIDFGTCGIIVAGGTSRYIKGELTSEPEEKRFKDGVAADAVLKKLLFASAVDDFQTYLSSLLLEILSHSPKAMFGKKFDARLLFESPDLESAKRRIVDRFILDLGYKSTQELTEFLSDVFGLKSLDNPLTKKRLNRIVQVRNIITHNRGIVSQFYLHRSGSKSDKLGTQVRVHSPLKTASYLRGLADKLDRHARTKFSLPSFKAVR
jgi:hypothetical protein